MIRVPQGLQSGVDMVNYWAFAIAVTRMCGLYLPVVSIRVSEKRFYVFLERKAPCVIPDSRMGTRGLLLHTVLFQRLHVSTSPIVGLISGARTICYQQSTGYDEDGSVDDNVCRTMDLALPQEGPLRGLVL